MAEYALEAIMKKCEIDDIIKSINSFEMIKTIRHISATLGMFHAVHASLSRDTENSVFNVNLLNNFIMIGTKNPKL